MIYEILGDGSVRIDSENRSYDFISKGIGTSREMFGLLEFIKLEYCSTNVRKDCFDALSEHFYGINALVRAGFRTPLVLLSITQERFRRRRTKGESKCNGGITLSKSTF
jgi:hypothetical protein